MYSDSSVSKLNFDFHQVKGVAVTLRTDDIGESDVTQSISEITQLARTLGVTIVESFVQRKKQIDSAYYLGLGKLQEIKAYMDQQGIDLLVVDHELSGVQERNIEKVIGKPILDRTAVILNIFSKRARSTEAKLQVELASMEYMMPRLRKLWTHFSRSEGVVGIRGGEGEKQLELDRRMIKNRITAIKNRLTKIDVQMKNRRRNRDDSNNVSLVGYTNAGKTSLMNLLSKKNLLAENMMFSTIDSTIRKVYIDEELTILLNDTVGFINKLPHSLVASFQSTLDEILNSRLILHVIDSSSEYVREQIASVDRVLKEIGADGIPTIRVYNKIDLLDQHTIGFMMNHPDDLLISTHTKQGIEQLKLRIKEFFVTGSVASF